MKSVIRGTTPTIFYRFPFDTSGIEKIRIYFLQGNETLITKTEDECLMNGNVVSVTLTESETYSMSIKKRLETKARFLLGESDKVCGTKSVFIDVEDTGGEEEVLADE